MRKDDPQINLRIPPDLKERIQEAAKKNRRTQTAEIIARLEKTIRDDELELNPNAVKIPDIPDRSDYIEIRDHLLSAVAQIEALLQSEDQDD